MGPLSPRSLLLSLLLFHLVGIIHLQRLCKLDVVQSSLPVRERTLEESVELNNKENQLICFNADVTLIPHLQSSCPRSLEANPSTPLALFFHRHRFVR